MNKFKKIMVISTCFFMSATTYVQAASTDPLTKEQCKAVKSKQVSKADAALIAKFYAQATAPNLVSALTISSGSFYPEIAKWCETNYDGDDLTEPEPEPDYGDGMIIEGGLGGLLSLNKPELGGTQNIEHDIGMVVALSLFRPIYTRDDWTITAGGQIIGGRASNKTLINVAPFPSSAFGGQTQYGGVLGILGIERYCACIGMFVGAYAGLGVGMVDFTGIQGGVTAVSGRELTPIFRTGVKAHKPIGNGFELGASLDFSYISGFNTTTNTGVTLKHGAIQDLAASISLRYKFGSQKQRLGLARPLLNDPQTLLLDEALAN